MSLCHPARGPRAAALATALVLVRLDLNPVFAATLQCGELAFDARACVFGGGSRLTRRY